MDKIVEKIAGEIPAGCEINLSIENGAVWVTLINRRGYITPVDGTDMNLNDQLEEALRIAKSDPE